MLFWNAVALAIGAAMDAVVGDPRNMLHMVVVFGAVISGWEKVLYRMNNKRLAGALLVVLTLLTCGAPIALLLWFAWRLYPLLYALWAGVLCWQCLAAKSLRDESDLVRVPLEAGDLPKAREMVGRIVGRDTDALDEAGVARAAVETVAENTSDGVIAPMFYLALGGPLLGCLYKAVNTMDSMVGYKNDKYMDFGRCAALLDDVVNYIPARLAALELILAAFLTGMDGKNAWRIWRRDRRNHASPNSAQTESAVAGALGLRLAGDAVYFGKLHKKPYIGDDLRPIEPEDIRRSHKLMFAATGEMLVLALAVMLSIHFL
jgi:adenosylcobinamide-phosphate synthase